MSVAKARSSIADYLGLIRFSHTVFALPFAVAAAMMAWARTAAESPDSPWPWRELLGVLLCMVFARSAAMAFNRLVDRRLDADNPRTAGRHLPAGLLTPTAVAGFTAACSAGFFASTLLFLPNWLPLALSIPVLAFLLGYSFAKRFTWLVHFWLGAALMLAPICAWIALRGASVLADPVDLAPALLLATAVWAWVAGFDVIYACQDEQFDRGRGLFSAPARWGTAGALRLAAACHVVAAAALLALGWSFPPFGWLFRGGAIAVAVLLVYEHALVRPNDLSRVNQAFFQVNAVISLGLLVVTAIDLWLY